MLHNGISVREPYYANIVALYSWVSLDIKPDGEKKNIAYI